ncbi:MAG: HEAT repeat domain-containing protein [Polyangiaceae bacterium]|nr:HEAT repeat domain-containing protein [Polyangiaceae bacterium]
MLGLPPLPRTLPAALRDISSKKPEIRAEAIRDLVRHSADARSEAVRAVEGALRDTDPRVRGAAATALSDMEAKESLPALLVAVEDDDAYVRQMAISALGEIGDVRAGERLRRALTDTRPEVRFQAVIAFPRVTARKTDAAEAVLAAMDDDDALVAHIAVRMAEELCEDNAARTELLSKAESLLKHDSDRVKLAAAVLLAHNGNDAGRSLFVKAATRAIKDVDGEDEAAAIELCGELQLTEAKPGLEKRAFSGLLGLGRDPFRWHARVALARMGHERAAQEITTDLASWDRDKRSLAVAAAGRARMVAARDTIRAMRGDPARADPDAVTEALLALDKKPAK